MPWRTESVMDQRVEFVIRAQRGEKSISQLCRDYGVSRPTGYLWLKRYREGGRISDLGRIMRLNTQGMLYYQGRSYFVSEALAQERVRVDQLAQKLLVTFRQLTVREISIRTGQNTAVLLPARTLIIPTEQ